MNQELRTKLEEASGWKLPKHDLLEFLLGKLPYKFTEKTGPTWILKLDNPEPKVWECYYHADMFVGKSDTPSGATARLAVYLFEANVLRKEEL